MTLFYIKLVYFYNFYLTLLVVYFIQMESLISITIRYFYKIIYVNINKYCDVCICMYCQKKTLPNIDIQKKKKGIV